MQNIVLFFISRFIQLLPLFSAVSDAEFVTHSLLYFFPALIYSIPFLAQPQFELSPSFVERVVLQLKSAHA